MKAIVNETKKKKMNIEQLMEKLPEGAIIYNNKYYYEYYKDIRAFEDGIAKIMSGKDNATFRQFIQRVVENE